MVSTLFYHVHLRIDDPEFDDIYRVAAGDSQSIFVLKGGTITTRTLEIVVNTCYVNRAMDCSIV